MQSIDFSLYSGQKTANIAKSSPVLSQTRTIGGEPVLGVHKKALVLTVWGRQQVPAVPILVIIL